MRAVESNLSLNKGESGVTWSSCSSLNCKYSCTASYASFVINEMYSSGSPAYTLSLPATISPLMVTGIRCLTFRYSTAPSLIPDDSITKVNALMRLSELAIIFLNSSIVHILSCAYLRSGGIVLLTFFQFNTTSFMSSNSLTDFMYPLIVPAEYCFLSTSFFFSSIKSMSFSSIDDLSALASATNESQSLPYHLRKPANLLSYGSLVCGLLIAERYNLIHLPSKLDLSTGFGNNRFSRFEAISVMQVQDIF